MPTLTDLQRQLSRAILRGEQDAGFGDHFRAWPVPAEEALSVHRNTVLGGLRDALRLSYPTVALLIGDNCFNQVVSHYAALYPPRTACLSLYGDGFPDYLQRFPTTAALAYLPDVARFDRRLERVASASDDSGSASAVTANIDDVLLLCLPPSLTLFEGQYPVDRIREAVTANDDDQLASLDMTPRPRRFAIWRSPRGVSLRPIGEAAGRFLTALLQGADAAAAIESASTGYSGQGVLVELETDVFRASFTRLVPLQPSPRGQS